MSATVVLLCVLATATALPDGFSKQPRPDFSMQPRVPHFKLPAFDTLLQVPRSTIACSRSLVRTRLAPGETATFQSPNHPRDYDSRSSCKWRFMSSTDITITCSNYIIQSSNRRGRCVDKLIIDGTQHCGRSSVTYPGGDSINVVFKSNKKKNFEGFSCTATAKSDGSVTTPAPGSCRCGQANRASRIVGGVETEVLEYPWQAALVYSRSTSVFCGASVIGSKHILTAAHCTQAVTDYSIGYQVLVGAHSRSSAAQSQQLLDASRIIQHSSYSDTTFDSDISIIVLRSHISFDSTDIRPVCLPTSDADDYAWINATVSGWGTTEYQGTQPDALMEVEVPTMTNTVCNNYYTNSITSNMICAGFRAGGKDSCQGDSGGPLFTNSQSGNSGSSYTQIGVVSWGYGCAWANYPGVYARVSKYLDWISTNSASSNTCP